MTQVTPNSVQQHIDLHLETGNTAARPKRTTVEELLLQTVEPASSMHIDNALEKHARTIKVKIYFLVYIITISYKTLYMYL